MKFKYYNDTNRIVNIHPATFAHGCTGDNKSIKPLEERTFILPEGTYPWVKMWDYGDTGLSILISPRAEENNKDKNENNKHEKDNGFWNQILDVIITQISPGSYDAWFKRTKGEIIENTLIVYCMNEFQRDWLEKKHQDKITSIAKQVTGKELELRVVCNENSIINM